MAAPAPERPQVPRTRHCSLSFIRWSLRTVIRGQSGTHEKYYFKKIHKPGTRPSIVKVSFLGPFPVIYIPKVFSSGTADAREVPAPGVSDFPNRVRYHASSRIPNWDLRVGPLCLSPEVRHIQIKKLGLAVLSMQRRRGAGARAISCDPV
ncbi:hypothetical protein EVAR_21055_1 [Eumeta japonica]|uniref:Uncharacterized protein n=1 Tax=Eumeta variegata TaxID=151549 RepID=A0A4C1V187_EUMVA|nr:hypothetical protein EVAR_21055_1 [Eumeta japonica]